MRGYASACRFEFNKALALQKTRYERGEKKLGCAGNRFTSAVQQSRANFGRRPNPDVRFFREGVGFRKQF